MTLAPYDNPDSPNCRKVRLMLAALALPFETRPVELSNGETRRAAFLAVNPSGQVPVLVHDGFVLPESDAILGYLAECFAPEWLMHDARARAIVRRFMGWLSKHGRVVPTPSIADLAIGAWLEVAERVGMLDDAPAMARWLARLQALDYWRLAGGYRLFHREMNPKQTSKGRSR